MQRDSKQNLVARPIGWELQRSNDKNRSDLLTEDSGWIGEVPLVPDPEPAGKNFTHRRSR